jgi:SAM-dependent methyltransferase
VNDGKSLEMVVDGGVDFIFSFDSLVHAEDTVLEAYAAECARTLRPDGAAFLHHSNLGAYRGGVRVQSQLSRVPKLLELLRRVRLCDNLTGQWRARSMTATKMASLAEQHGLQCISQELVNWESRGALVDCLSTLVPQGSKWSRQNRVLRNPGFMSEAARLHGLSRLYEWPPMAGPRAIGVGRE